MFIRALGVLGIVALASFLMPAAVEAQQAGPQKAGKVWRIGLFHVGLDHVPPSLEQFRITLKALGYEEGRNVRLDWRNLPDEEAARETARTFVADRVDLIVAFENQTARAAKAATTDIPVVFVHAGDPVSNGFVKSLSHPGGNLTGFVGVSDLPAKSMQLFKELVPRLQRLLVLTDPKDPETPERLDAIVTAGALLKITLVRREASTQADLEHVFGALKPREVDGVFVVSPYLYLKFSSVLVRLATKKRLPLPSHRKEWVEQGALFSYRQDTAADGAGAARYVDRIFRGTKPADLPVQQPTTFELVINLKVAKALGLTVPQTVLLRAHRVIE